MTPDDVLFIRSELNLTQAGLAARMGVTRLTVSRWEMQDGRYPIPPGAQLLLLSLGKAERTGPPAQQTVKASARGARRAR